MRGYPRKRPRKDMKGLEASGSDRQDIIDSCICLDDSGFMIGHSGNVSLRCGDGFLITPSGVPYNEMSLDSLRTVYIESGTVGDDGGSFRPSSESPLHRLLYLNTDAGAIVHTHSLYSVAVGLVADELPLIHYMMRVLGGKIRVANYATFGSYELAENVLDAIGDRSAVLMRNHGSVVIGSSLSDACEKAVKLEWLCRLYMATLSVGRPHYLSPDDLVKASVQAGHGGYFG